MGGAKKRPVYKIVVADSRFPRDGRFIEKVGFFNPLLPKTKKERINLEIERIKHWISKGAKPTLRVSRILGEAKVLPMPPKGNNPLKAIPKKDRKKDGLDGKKLSINFDITKTVNLLDWKPQYTEKFWKGNAVAIGLSAGFLMFYQRSICPFNHPR